VVGYPTRYRIVLRGELSDRYRAEFGDMTFECAEGLTVLVGDVADQSQLHGLLDRVAQLGIELVAVGPATHEAAMLTNGDRG
jgi:hypothetical protein